VVDSVICVMEFDDVGDLAGPCDTANDLYFTLKGTVMLPSKSMDVYRKVRTQSNRQLDCQLDSHPVFRPPNQAASWIHTGLALSPPTQSNRQLDSHQSHTQPSHPIKPPAGLTPSAPTQSNRQLDSHPALPPNQTASWTHTQRSHPMKPPGWRAVRAGGDLQEGGAAGAGGSQYHRVGAVGGGWGCGRAV